MIVKCPECGAEISSNAKSCPKCGYSKIRQIDPRYGLKRRHTAKIIIIVCICVSVFTGMIITAMKIQKNEEEQFDRAYENVQRLKKKEKKIRQDSEKIENGTYDRYEDNDYDDYKSKDDYDWWWTPKK